MKIKSKDIRYCDNCSLSESDHLGDQNMCFCKKFSIRSKKYQIRNDCPHYRKTHTKSKYGAVSSLVDGTNFASKFEAERFRELLLQKKAGNISWFIRQPMFDMGAGVVYRADYLSVKKLKVDTIKKLLKDFGDDLEYASLQIVDLINNLVTIEDVKGYITPIFTRNKKLVEKKYGFEIKVIRK